MRWMWVVFLVIALLAGALWMTSALAAGIAKLIVGIFVVLFLVSLLFTAKRKRTS